MDHFRRQRQDIRCACCWEPTTNRTALACRLARGALVAALALTETP